ncbi:MAG: hypothetical protein AAFX81_01345 [Pseudomonadota bacterium]
MTAKLIPVGFVPVPSDAYRRHRKTREATVEPGKPRVAPTIPVPRPTTPLPASVSGSRVLIYKQDPTVTEIGVRKCYLPGPVVAGPGDARIVNGTPGLPAVSANMFGDFIQQPDTPEFDAVHTFAVVRQTLTMYQRALGDQAPAPLPWAWNSVTDTRPLEVFPHGLPDTMNAFYSRTDRALKFGHFVADDDGRRVHTCRSFDIVAHECGHAILDGLKPDWILFGQPPQTGGLHESFGDLTAIFLTLAQHDQVEAVVAQTKADLHNKTFLADVAEEFGLALGRPNGLRNADNDLTLSQTGTQVHAISQVMTGAVYDILADIVAFERRPFLRDDATVLHEVGAYLCSLVVRSIIRAPDNGATYADVANQMLAICAEDGKPTAYLNAIRNRFAVREVVTTEEALTAAVEAGTRLAVGMSDGERAVQDRRACCGTMNAPEFCGMAAWFDAELTALRACFSTS